jgi:hypothetical protein
MCEVRRWRWKDRWHKRGEQELWTIGGYPSREWELRGKKKIKDREWEGAWWAGGCGTYQWHCDQDGEQRNQDWQPCIWFCHIEHTWESWGSLHRSSRRHGSSASGYRSRMSSAGCKHVCQDPPQTSSVKSPSVVPADSLLSSWLLSSSLASCTTTSTSPAKLLRIQTPNPLTLLFVAHRKIISFRRRKKSNYYDAWSDLGSCKHGPKDSIPSPITPSRFEEELRFASGKPKP